MKSGLYRIFYPLLIVICVGCNSSDNNFSKADIETQDLFIALLDLTHHSVDKLSIIDSIKTIKLPEVDQIIKSSEPSGYVDVPIKLREEERRLYFYRDVMKLYKVNKGECFLPSIDHNFPLIDVAYNIKPCLGNLYTKIEPDLASKFSENYSVNSLLLEEINKALKRHGSEMGIVNLYDDQFYFIFFPQKNKSKIYAIFDALGMEIGDENTFFRAFIR